MFKRHADQFRGGYEPVETSPSLAGSSSPRAQQKKPCLSRLKKSSVQWLLENSISFGERLRTFFPFCGNVLFVRHVFPFWPSLSGDGLSI